jgi:hypothetical protein
MRLRVAIYACVLVAIAGSAAQAADLGDTAPPYGPRADLAGSVVVVPACEESVRAVLMRCLPRREIVRPEDVGLIRIERSLGRPGPLPYKQLFTWP